MAHSQVTAQPRDALVMAGILRDMGVGEHEPRVINQMLEFAHRYSTEILGDAAAFAAIAGRSRVEAEDVAAGLDNRADTAFDRPPPRDLLLELAKDRNAAPLPPIRVQHGLRLPPDRHCLVQPNYRLRSDAPAIVQAHLAQPPPQHSQGDGTSLSLNSQPPNASFTIGSAQKRKLEDEEDDYDQE